MNRRRFLVIAAAVPVTVSAGVAPRTVLARTSSLARVSLIRWPRELLSGVPGRCAGMRTATRFDLSRMLSLR